MFAPVGELRDRLDALRDALEAPAKRAQERPLCARCGHNPVCHLSNSAHAMKPGCVGYAPCSPKPVCARYTRPRKR